MGFLECQTLPKQVPGITVALSDTIAPTAQPASKPNVVKSPQKLSVNGAAHLPEIYNIGNTNFFKIRDLAELLNGTSAQFDVSYDAGRNTVVLTTGVPYADATGRVREGTQDRSSTAVASPQSIEINGEAVELTAYNIGNTNFFGLRALQPYLGYKVDYDAETNTAFITTE